MQRNNKRAFFKVIKILMCEYNNVNTNCLQYKDNVIFQKFS